MSFHQLLQVGQTTFELSFHQGHKNRRCQLEKAARLGFEYERDSCVACDALKSKLGLRRHALFVLPCDFVVRLVFHDLRFGFTSLAQPIANASPVRYQYQRSSKSILFTDHFDLSKHASLSASQSPPTDQFCS